VDKGKSYLGTSTHNLCLSSPTHEFYREMHRLPQELTDYIIDFLHDDPDTLKRASLVSKAWLDCSRHHLFETLSIKYFKLTDLGPADLATPCKYARRLMFLWTSDPVKASSMLSNFGESKIHTLVIRSCRVYHFNQLNLRRCFSAFPCTMITSLEYRSLFCQPRMFLALTSLFPNLDNLTIAVYRWYESDSSQMDEELVNQIIFPSFRGSFKLTSPRGRLSWDYGRTEALYLLACMPIQFHTVSFYVNKNNLINVSSFLDSCALTVRRIFLDAAQCKLHPPPPQYMVYNIAYSVKTAPDGGFLVPCVNLEELHLGDGFFDIPDTFIRCLLDSISSRTLRHLTIELSDRSRAKIRAVWEALDEALIRLWRRQEVGGRLTVEFSTPLPVGEVQGHLPRFRDQGLLYVGCRGRPSCW